MLHYAIQAGRMNEMMELLFHVLDIRITFFDLMECEVEGFNIKEMSAFCRYRRRGKAFDARCRRCDRENLRIAKNTGQVHIYRCHAGLLEGIVPMYDRHKRYVGAIVFGQVRACGCSYAEMTKTARDLLLRCGESTPKKMRDIGALLKCLTEYIIDNEIIRYRNKPWVERVEHYIEAHVAERITLARLADEIGRSSSFLSHHFRKEFGVSLKTYILEKRMTRAREMLRAGSPLRTIADALGFYDEFHFSKTFKRFFGDSPRHFIRRESGLTAGDPGAPPSR